MKTSDEFINPFYKMYIPKILHHATHFFFTNHKIIISGSAYAYANLGSEGHTRIIRYLVNKGANINNFSKNGNTALMFAAR